MQFLRSLVFYVVLILWVLVVVPPLLLMMVLPLRRRGGAARAMSRWLLGALRVICGVDYEVRGREHTAGGAAIIMSKHQSAWETFALQILFPPLAYVLKRELLWIPFFGWGLLACGAIAIDRKKGKVALKQVLSKGTARLRDGIWVVIFPEGTRIPPGRRGRYNVGGAMLAARSGFPVVPVAHNAGEFWPGEGFVIRPGTITVVVGEPLDTTDMRPGEINAYVEHWIESQMEAISLQDKDLADRRAMGAEIVAGEKVKRD
ncbi:1-acyl-sn-glycerol-3-phosphate acyltransferase [bacterium DOLZORAL124_64_63]|nr:MAG: 1-acyl-sn-glycerol-3-phosphate acyltransferase [bacterium DOLZORAL124_64_63]